jgi:mRNA-degrading endonuclease RelE of RelBE toxin-antitoxin system
MAACYFVEITDKQISEIKINSVPKNTKDLCKNTKTIIRLRLGDYRGIFTGLHFVSVNVPQQF